MGDSRPPLRKQPLRSLASKMIFVVFLSTFLTAVVVSWISVHSTYRFLSAQLDRSLPSLLDETSQRVTGWLAEGSSELEQVAAQPALLRALSRPSSAGASLPALNAALRDTRFFEALVLLDGHGKRVAQASGPDLPQSTAHQPCLAEGNSGKELRALADAHGTATPVALAPVAQDPDRVRGTLCGRFRRSALVELLGSDGIRASGEIYLVDAAGRIQLRSGKDDGSGFTSAARIPGGTVRQYRSHSGVRVVGAALPLGALGWTVVVEQPLNEVFEPVFSVMTRVFVIDLCIILLFSFLAYQVTATVVHPIEALSDGARRISRGELDVAIPNVKGSDEISLLTRTFNDMTYKLLHHRTEIQEANRRLLAQNSELQRVNEILEQLSITDGLTKLHNHRFFQEHLTREIKRASRSGEPLSLLLLDIDDFKQLNDRFGHVAGDEILVRLAQILNQSMRDIDLTARYGGEEFAVLAANTELEGAVNLGEKIRTAVAETPFIAGDSMRPMRITISIGVAQYRGSRKQLLRAADRALYRAKDEGKNCVVAEMVEATEAQQPTVLDRET